MEKRQKLMKDFKEYRDKKILEWTKQKQQRLELRNCKCLRIIPRRDENLRFLILKIVFSQMSILMNLMRTRKSFTKKKLLNLLLKKILPSSIENKHRRSNLFFFGGRSIILSFGLSIPR